MAKKQGLGASVNKSIKVMEDLIDSLIKFSNMSIKKNLTVIEKDEREDLNKMINDTSEIAFSLRNKVDDLKNKVEELAPKGNSRFARNVVTKFLGNEE